MQEFLLIVLKVLDRLLNRKGRFEMKKIFKSFLCMMLVAVLLVPNISAFASTKSKETVSKQQVSIVKNNIETLENELAKHHTDVISELNKQISDYQTILKNAASTEDQNKIERLIITSKELIQDYSDYKQYRSSNIISNSDPVLEAEVATVIAYFQANGYKLAAELLTHARDSHRPDDLYEPYYGYLCAKSPVVDAIWNSSSLYGSAEFSANAFSSTVVKDLKYAIHEFCFIKHLNIGSSSYLEITDEYDYSSGDYTSVAGIAIEAMYQAQEAGILVPYEVYIELSR